ncbi:MAG: winged helix-turn-helix transcriptional regulator [Acholeplasmatales bacterium]|nr:winged helix-turn-helix transcriptional regulator [Acholeplasmatales bacterium]
MSDKFWDDLNQFKNRYQEMLDDVCQSFGLNPAEANIILYLAKNKNDTATDIVKYTGYSKSNVSTAVRKLELSDYLSTICPSENRRIVHLKLKEKAKPIIRYYQKQKKKLEDELFFGFTKEELEALFFLSDKVSRNIIGEGK